MAKGEADGKGAKKKKTQEASKSAKPDHMSDDLWVRPAY